jgi:hypothetical protein
MRTDARSVVDAHTASCEVAGSKSLSQEERLDVLTALGFLAGILPCWVFAENLPPWKEIPNYGRSGGRVQKIYEALVQERTNGDGLRPIKMSEALALYGGLKLIGSSCHPSSLGGSRSSHGQSSPRAGLPHGERPVDPKATTV